MHKTGDRKMTEKSFNVYVNSANEKIDSELIKDIESLLYKYKLPKDMIKDASKILLFYIRSVEATIPGGIFGDKFSTRDNIDYIYEAVRKAIQNCSEKTFSQYEYLHALFSTILFFIGLTEKVEKED